MSTQIEFLIDHQETVPVVCGWLFDEWAHRRPHLTRAGHVAEMMLALSRDCVPIQLVALDDHTPCGVAILKPHEMRYPTWKYWLGSVFVRPETRGRGIATLLCQRIETVARSLGIGRLHVQTKRLDGGLYSHLGFQPVEQSHYDDYHVLVMAKNL